LEDDHQTGALSARSRNRRPTIGFLTHGIWDTFGVVLWHGVIDAAQEEDANLVCFPGGDLNAARQPFEAQANIIYDLASAENVNGLVISGSALSSFVGLEGLRTFCDWYRPLPMATISAALEGIPSVLVDNYQGVRDAMTHLFEIHGCRRVAFIPGPADNAEVQERYRAYSDALREHGSFFDPDLVAPPGDWNPPSGWDAIHVLLDQRQAKFDAVVVANDGMAIGALEALQARGIAVPEDVIVTGFNDSEEVRFATPPFTTIRQPIHGQVKQATKMVLAQLRGEQVPAQATLPTKLVVRQSCGCLDPKVAQAAAGPVTASGDMSEAVRVACREMALREMSRAAEDLSDRLPAGWTADLLDAFDADLAGEPAGGFLPALDKVLRQVMTAGGDVADWHAVLSVLRRHMLPGLGSAEVLRAEDLWQQARVMIGETARRVEMHQAWRETQQARMLGEIEGALITTFDLTGLMNILVERLPRLGIPSCYVSLYEDPAMPTAWARLILAYNEQGRVALEAGGWRFPSQHLVPEGLLSRDRRYNLVVAPLYFQEGQLGFVVFGVERRDGDIYEIVRRELSSALQGVLLMQSREEARKALAQAYAGVEEQVKQRTAELQQEIAERRQAQEALAEERNLLRTLIDNVPDLIYVKDAQSRFVLANSATARFMGASSPDELLGKTDFDFYPEQLASQFWADEQSIIESGQPLISKGEPNIDCAGTTRWLLTTKVPLRDNEGKIVGLVGIGRDVTARRQAEEVLQQRAQELATLASQNALLHKQVEHYAAELEQRVVERTAQLEAAVKELEAFSYSVSHDLRAPLRAIDGFTRILLEDYGPSLDAEGKRVCRVISDNTRHMGQLIDDLLAFSRLSRADMRPVPIDMEALANSAFHQLTTPESRARIDFRLGALPPAVGDPTLIGQVWLNLLSNAIKFSSKREQAVVEVGCRESEGESAYYVRDNGAGFDMRYAGKLFGVFQRLHSEREFEGTGVGLAIVQRTISRHGGRVWAEGEVERGATFYFTLPQKGA
jgi:PAS domain S-box-containing protein